VRFVGVGAGEVTRRARRRRSGGMKWAEIFEFPGVLGVAPQAK